MSQHLAKEETEAVQGQVDAEGHWGDTEGPLSQWLNCCSALSVSPSALVEKEEWVSSGQESPRRKFQGQYGHICWPPGHICYHTAVSSAVSVEGALVLPNHMRTYSLCMSVHM